MINKMKFNDFIRLNRGFDLPESQIESGEYPVVASTNIKAYHKQYKVDGPAVVTGRSGSLGKVQYVDGKCWPLNTSLYVKDFKGNYPRYVYYYLQIMHLEQFNSGAGVPTLNQNHLHSMKVLIHDIQEQRKVATILAAYDNLIENNNKRIKILEQMAENLYKEWFVRFRFPGYENAEFVDGLPKGWSRNKLKTYYNTSSGGTPSRSISSYYENGSIPWVKTGEITDTIILGTEEYITEDAVKHSSAKKIASGSLLMAMYGVNIGQLGIVAKEMTCNQAACVFSEKRAFSSRFYLFYYLKSIREYLLLIGFGAAQQNLSQELIQNIRIVMPTDGIVMAFEQKIGVMYDEIQSLLEKNANLVKQRDLLLPRLMSGKLSV